jgi:dTDP-4-dehydrorhamnose 3,5-epimerase
MEIKERRIKGVFEIDLKPFTDDRGFFMRTYDSELFKKAGINCKWIQENHSCSEKKNILRGLHFQFPPYAETKLVRCIRGAVLDVFVDLRKESVSFGQWDSIELSEENKKMILIPRGFAHGFCTLTDCSEVLYKVDNCYSKESEAGIIWNDPDLNINWPVTDPILSAKDQNNMTLQEFVKKSYS